MRRNHKTWLVAAAICTALASGPAVAKKSGPTAKIARAEVGKSAPAFSLKDTSGKTVTLASFRGKTVVLEWFNPGCPFVKYSHSDGPLRDMASRWQTEGVVWLAVNSGAAGKQGHGLQANAEAKKQWKMSYPVLLDEAGKVGRLYGAKTTPHVFVINPKGKIVYAGALDNAPFGRAPAQGVAGYVEDALKAVLKGSAVKVKESKPYGCSVKYSS